MDIPYQLPITLNAMLNGKEGEKGQVLISITLLVNMPLAQVERRPIPCG